MRGTRETIAVLMAALLTVSIVSMVAVFGAGSVGAVHPDDAPDMTEHANYTVNFPHATDHYPGSQNEENGSIEYFSAGEDAFHENDASEGVYMNWIIVHAEYDGENWIDYSACDTENTKAFGIDRGNDNQGTEYDEDLVTHRKDGEFRDDGVTVEFYDWEDIAEDPPYLAPEDAIVAAQGAGSAAGPCLTLTDQPGWYRVAGFMNGTVADNGEGEEPSEDAEEVSLQLQSNYLYVCECDSEEEAREELGPPPNEDGEEGAEGGEEGGEEEGDEETEAEDDGEAEEEGDQETEAEDDGAADEEGDEETEAEDDGAGEDDGGAEDDGAGEDDGGAEDDGDEPVVEDDQDTPEEDDQPGFGVVAALVALLAGALAAHRRG